MSKETNPDAATTDSVQPVAALAAVDEYFAAFNARDPQRFAQSLHYPHVRIDGLGQPRVWERWEDYAAVVDFAVIVRRDRWHRTVLDWKRVLQRGESKVHVAVGFTRRDAAGEPLVSEESLYVVTCRGGRWGIQMRSSFLEQPVAATAAGGQSG